jgi:hypothetical protein
MVLDSLLSLQLLVAWSGEGLSEPKRLNWWRTDLVDEGGGGDFLLRLLPKTHQWAALSAVRQAAIQVDRQMRLESSNPDSLRTLFFWGFDVDEKLSERLADHKRSGITVGEVMPKLSNLQKTFSMDEFKIVLQSKQQQVKFNILPSGREVLGTIPDALDQRAEMLMSALCPLAERYPMPFYRTEL